MLEWFDYVKRRKDVLKNLIGDRAFYKQIVVLMLPIMVQNGITNFVNMLDNIMIGAVGTAEMTGVAITNQLFFVFNLCIFGAVSGAGIFGAQFFGSGDHEGVRHTFRFKLIFSLILSAIGIAVFYFLGGDLLDLYMQGEEGITDMAATLSYAKSYMMIMLVGIIPYALVQCYASTLREGAHPTLPMIAGVVAVCVNLVLNYLLIFGRLGLPRMGVAGAAAATVISRFAELAVVVIASHAGKAKYPFMQGVYKSLYIPLDLVGKLFIRGLPLMLNETLWATGMAVVNQCYSLRGLDGVAACNISQTFWNVFSIAYMAVGAAIGIIIGQMLGASRLDQARKASYKMIAFSFALALSVAVVYFIVARYIPYVYNTEPEIRELATRIMRVTAIVMPFEAVTHSTYFTLRSGGKMLVTFIFDCGFMWGISVILAYALATFTTLSFFTVFTIVQLTSALKSVIGVLLVKNGFWVKNIISSQP